MVHKNLSKAVVENNRKRKGIKLKNEFLSKELNNLIKLCLKFYNHSWLTKGEFAVKTNLTTNTISCIFSRNKQYFQVQRRFKRGGNKDKFRFNLPVAFKRMEELFNEEFLYYDFILGNLEEFISYFNSKVNEASLTKIIRLFGAKANKEHITKSFKEYVKNDYGITTKREGRELIFRINDIKLLKKKIKLNTMEHLASISILREEFYQKMRGDTQKQD
ncbi:MAG: hypothetical protein HQ541_10050 [Mariniphaga sp.]|nr:hypothetical protein [Mariniphaga sp.]